MWQKQRWPPGSFGFTIYLYLKDALRVSNQAAAQKVLDSDSMMSPDLSPFGLPLDNMAERRRSQALIGVADVEANLSEEKLLQVDMTDGGKVGGEGSGCFCTIRNGLRTTSNIFHFPISPSTRSSLDLSPRGLGEAVRSPPSSTSA